LAQRFALLCFALPCSAPHHFAAVALCAFCVAEKQHELGLLTAEAGFALVQAVITLRSPSVQALCNSCRHALA
jgi:hypothetical protein